MNIQGPSLLDNGDSIEDFFDTKIVSPEVEPEPLREPSVPTTPIRSSHLEVWDPFQAGLRAINDELELRRLFYRELFQRGPYSLTPFFNGNVRSTLVGVYCLFYVGDMWEPYAPLRSEASTLILYAGRAALSSSVFSRVQSHARSIHQQGLGLENFTCRFMGLPRWFHGEQVLLRDFSPVWNNHLRGFGHTGAYYGDIQKVVVPDWDLFHQDLTGKVRSCSFPMSASQLHERDRPTSLEDVRKKFSAGVRESLIRYWRSKDLLKATGVTPEVEPGPLREPPGGGDSIEEFPPGGGDAIEKFLEVFNV